MPERHTRHKLLLLVVWVEQIPHVLYVDFEAAHHYFGSFLVLNVLIVLDRLENHLYCSRHDASFVTLATLHSVRLAGTSLPVCEYADIVPIQGTANNILDLIINGLL